VVRYRRAHGVERLQLRWVTLAAALTGVAMVAFAVLLALGSRLADWISAGATIFLPLATGAAILRYRLYDLDRVISRTLAYGLLTVLLAGGYAGVALALGGLLGRDSSLAVAGATLAVAAAFQPARRRVQRLVDRRFNRRRHDAARVIEGFGARLRDQVDLERLTAELLAVAEQTMQPTRASLWLRSSPSQVRTAGPAAR
jgi:peptidoglycan/LPS O-acetylase OafA/YrhL